MAEPRWLADTDLGDKRRRSRSSCVGFARNGDGRRPADPRRNLSKRQQLHAAACVKNGDIAGPAYRGTSQVNYCAVNRMKSDLTRRKETSDGQRTRKKSPPD
jgi:hypothetical protein